MGTVKVDGDKKDDEDDDGDGDSFKDDDDNSADDDELERGGEQGVSEIGGGDEDSRENLIGFDVALLAMAVLARGRGGDFGAPSPSPASQAYDADRLRVLRVERAADALWACDVLQQGVEQVFCSGVSSLASK